MRRIRFAPVVARLTGRAADTALSQGADPAGSKRLAARARQLTSPVTRRHTAEGLERLALVPERPPAWPRVSPSRAATGANRATLLELAGLLRADQPVYAGGVATLSLLLRDGTGPVYTDRHGEGLAAALALARRRLRDGDALALHDPSLEISAEVRAEAVTGRAGARRRGVRSR